MAQGDGVGPIRVDEYVGEDVVFTQHFIMHCPRCQIPMVAGKTVLSFGAFLAVEWWCERCYYEVIVPDDEMIDKRSGMHKSFSNKTIDINSRGALGV
jgi:hypothetical protein